MNFWSFVSNMRPEHKRLLERKDPRTLLLLAYWYAKVCQCQVWWLLRRAAFEYQAICIFLERYRGHEMDIRELLQHILRLICGIVAPRSNKCAIDVQDSICVRKIGRRGANLLGFVKRLSSNKKAKDAMGACLKVCSLCLGLV